MSARLLIEYLSTHEKSESWEQLAVKFNLSSGEAARNVWKRYRKRAPESPDSSKSDGYENVVTSIEEDLKAGRSTVTARLENEIRTLDELIDKCKIDTSIWRIEKCVQNFWGNHNDPHWQVKAFLARKTPQDQFQQSFIKFLENYSPEIKPVKIPVKRPTSLLIIDKQDSHLNKYDTKGENSIDKRFQAIEKAIGTVLWKSSSFDALEAKYILGSDQFNSEWTNTTTRGTPQENILQYHESFEAICNHEVACITLLLTLCQNVEVVFIPGNHDEYVGWHMVHWLQAYYKEESRIKFDIGPEPTKCFRFSNSAIMFNHGYSMKPPKLAQLFPMMFKDEWSKCEYQYIFTGDKHKEFEKDFSGIKFYGLPALSGSSSKYDREKGFIDKGILTAFLIRENTGLSTIYKEPIIT